MSEATTGGVSDSFDRPGDSKKKGSLFSKFNARLQDAVEQGRGEEAVRQSVIESAKAPAVPADDAAVRSAQTLTLQRMIVPEGVVIEGAMRSSSETQIAGRIDGDVTVEGRLGLDPTAVIIGKVRATACVVQGKIDGNLESTHELLIGESGRVKANAMSGKDMTIAGTLKGNVKCGGLLRLMGTAKLTGDIRARSIVIDEGAMFNGKCTMAKPNQSKSNSHKKDKQ